MIIDGNLEEYEEIITKVFSEAEKVVVEDFSKVSVSVNFVSDEEIHELNKKYRNVDRATDVLSFPNLDKKINEKLIKFQDQADFDTGLLFVGDIVISKNYANIEKEEYGFDLTQEIAFLALHGLLHLLGYDHMTEKDEEIMFKIQDEVFDRCGL